MAIKYRVLSFIIFIVVVAFLGVGYAAVTNNLSIGGTAEADPPDTLVITKVETISQTVNSESHSIVGDTNVQTYLSGRNGQKLVYRITARNYSKTDTFVFNGIVFENLGDEINGNITVSTDANGRNQLPSTRNPVYASGTPIAPGEEYVFYATYSVSNTVNSGNILVNYIFDPIVYTITYLDNNTVYATDCIINNNNVYNVRTDHPTAGYDGKKFMGWMNANANVVTSYPAGNTTSYTLTSKWDSIYTIMFVDRNGNVLYQEQFTSSSTALSSTGQAEVNRILAELNEAALMEEMTVTWSDYTIKGAKADIVVRPNYTYHGNLQYRPVDTNGDGIVDYYKVVAVSGLDKDVTILGQLNGKPVEVVEKLYDNDGNLDYNSAVQVIRIEEGMKELQHNALSHTKNLKTVYLPNSLEHLGKNTFSRNWGNDKKAITIVYNGSLSEWKSLVANSHDEWANGLEKGTVVQCKDGYMKLESGGFLGLGTQWKEYHTNT